jgi:hypothetical protein
MFINLEEEEKQELFDAMFEVNFKAGDTIIRQGFFAACTPHSHKTTTHL